MKRLIFILLLFMAIPLYSTTWYVRPAGGSYGNEDGTAYADAWDGLSNVVWGGAGVVAGDTLYICGLHLRTRTDPGDDAWETITTNSGTVGNRITVRGDYAGDAGIVWGGGVMAQEAWADEGDDTWSITLDTSMMGVYCYEDVTAETWTVLAEATSVQNCKDTAGSYYGTYGQGSTFYVHCSDDNAPTNRITRERTGYKFDCHQEEYIDWVNLEFYANYNQWLAAEDGEYVKNMKWDGCTVWYAETNCIKFTSDTEYVEVTDCDVAYCDKEGIGVGTYGDPEATTQNYTFKDNYIHDIGTRRGDSDAHGIGMQGGTGLIEGNEIYNCGSGITMYAWHNMGCDLIIRYNYIHDMHYIGGANARGIELNMHPTDVAVKSAEVYYNIVANCNESNDGVGYRTTFSNSDVEFYNNVAYNCYYSFFFEFDGTPGQKITMKNNISLSPGLRHIYFENPNTSPGAYYIISDYNCFYPMSGNQFRFRDDTDATTTNLVGWQALVKAGCTFDPNSITDDPSLVGDGYDTQIKFYTDNVGDPPVDAGTNVGLTVDIESQLVPSGTDPDIGVNEYQQGDMAVIRARGTIRSRKVVRAGGIT